MTTPEQLLERLAAVERTATGPPAETGERVWTAIEDRLVNGPAPPELDQGPLLEHAPQVAANVGTSSSVVLKLVGALVLVGAIGGGAAVLSADRQSNVVATPEPSPPVTQPQGAATEPSLPEPVLLQPTRMEPEMPEVPEVPQPPESDVPSSKAKTQPKAPAQPRSLADEVALMQALSTALKQGDSRKALALVAEHERDFADGQFVEERRAAKARSLCQSGKLAAGKREAERFASRWPDSIHLTSVNKDCGLE
jgi:hypothetical protein